MRETVVDLFASMEHANRDAAKPLAARMRPTSLDAFFGQQHILAPGKLLRRMIEADLVASAVFYGPPGTGKTTLARLIAGRTRKTFVPVNAAATNLKELRELLASARERLGSAGQRTLLFIDEIHRFPRNVQDVLLADVEEGVITLISATTENPFFSINAPLVSRSQIFQFEALSEEEVAAVVRRAIADPDHGFGHLPLEVSDEAIAFWAKLSDGDARRALTALEIAVLSQIEAGGGKPTATAPASTMRECAPARDPPVDAVAAAPPGENPTRIAIDLNVARESMQKKAQGYDSTGDAHYDTASALIKSMRGSDPDAAIYWLARMLAAGEDPRFIARRVAICASEDIGNADPMALVVCAAAVQVTEFIGLPECQLTLAQAVTYLACSPKSNAATLAIGEAMDDVRGQRTTPVPKALRDTHYAGSARLGHEGYQYPHDAPEGYIEQDYLGVDKTFYRPVDRGHEKVFRRYLEKLAAMGKSAARVKANDAPMPKA